MQNPCQNGQQAENIALVYLKQHNLKLLHKNFHSRFGEIDLIMRDKDCVVFVEVRKRSSGIDDAIFSVSIAKQQKLIKAAQFFLVKIGYDIACRFDIIAIDAKHNIQWLKNIIFL